MSHPLIRRRSGTGGLYSDNLGRVPRSSVRRLPRGKSQFPRAATKDRPWMQNDEVPDHVELAEIAEAAAKAAGLLIELLRDVGMWVQHCRRWREPLPRDVVGELGELLDWYFVLHTVGLVDSRGAWLGPRR